jgi:hypothetical protein
MTDDRITQEELVRLFGATMPIEAAALFFEADLTAGEVRQKLQVIAKDPDRLDALLCELLMAETPEHQWELRQYIIRNYQRIS